MGELFRNPRLIMAEVVGTVERVSGKGDVVWHEGPIIPREGNECSADRLLDVAARQYETNRSRSARQHLRYVESDITAGGMTQDER